MQQTENRFDSVLYGVAPKLRGVLERVPESVKQKTEEIRLRSGLPVCLTVKARSFFVRQDGSVAEIISRDLLKAGPEELKESFMLLCKNSVYAHSAELRDGYIMMRSGHRAGVCGTFTEQGTFRDVTSINIRIARQIFGSANNIMSQYSGEGLLIAGPPGSGKTTLLRDMIRQLSYGINCEPKRIAVVDSRGELSGSSAGVSANDLGPNTDVLMIRDKAAGVEIALRTLFPHIVAFDEIGTAAELDGVAESFNAGINVITTAHAGSVSDLLLRSVTNGLIHSGAVHQIAMLSGDRCGEVSIYSAKELMDDIYD